MESSTRPTQVEDCKFLAKPSIKVKDLPYVKASKMIYVNLFQISMLKNWIVYQYPITFTPEVAKENPRMKRALFYKVEAKVAQTYGENFLAGDTLYSFREVKDLQQFAFTDDRNKIDYVLSIAPVANNFALCDANPLQNAAIKQIYELIFKEILRANPNLEFYRNLFVKKNDMKTVSSNRTKVDFYPGFSTALVYTTNGPFLNISIKNKILSTASCLEILTGLKKTKGKFTPAEEEEIRDYFIRRSVKTTYNRRNYIVDEISFDKTPKSTNVNREGKNLTLLNYYKVAHGITIKNVDQPLFVVYTKGPNGESSTIYIVPELCVLAGIDDTATKDGTFMKNLANLTKLSPKERVSGINEFRALLDDKNCKTILDPKTKKVIEKLPSSYEKKNTFALEVLPAEKNSFSAHYMSIPLLLAGKNTKIAPEERKPVPVSVSKDLKNWLCVYHKENYDDANILYDSLSKASKAYGIQVSEPEWVEMNSTKVSDWTEEVESFFDKKDYSFVVFLLDSYIDRLYTGLKTHSLCTFGYRSQVVKAESLKKNAMSVCSKILLQVNYKLGGCTYKVDFGNDVRKQNLMIVGVDSSHISGKRTGVAMLASMNSDFTDYYSKIDIILESKKETLIFCVASFLREAVNKFYQKNKKLPGGIIIYRQGVSRGQKEFLKSEVAQIENFLRGTDDSQLLKNSPISYYYVMVNTKTSFKFFEKEIQRNKEDFFNPSPGLLVMEEITDPSFYEFYIQPQDVTQGTATPTCYHVAFGNLDYPSLVPKLTFDLCFLYANWTGPVRVPGPLKSAEKLSKLTAKYTKSEIHESLKLSQSHL